MSDDEQVPGEGVAEQAALEAADVVIAATEPVFTYLDPELRVEAFLIEWTLHRDPRQCNVVEAANAFHGGSFSTPEQFDLVRRVWRRLYPSE